MKKQIQRALAKANLAASRTAPYLSRRYPYTQARRMHDALGAQLNEPTRWEAVDTAPAGALGQVFSNSPGLHKWVHYLPVYESILDRAHPIRMLEIGVFHGGSLKMWREYLHPDSVIVGIDIDPQCKQFDDPSDNVHVRIGGQQDPQFLQEVVDEFGPFDVILDDGSHMTSHMVESFRYLFGSALTERGVYIVEDVHTNFWKSHRDSPMSFVEFVAVLVDAMHAHYHDATGEQKFRIGHPERLSGVTVPAVTRSLESIEIRDSIIVVRKAPRELPRSIYVESPSS